MTKPKTKRMSIETVLYDPGTPLPMKRELMLQLASADDEKSIAILARWFHKADSAAAEEQYLHKTNELNELIQQMQQAPLRCASESLFI